MTKKTIPGPCVFSSLVCGLCALMAGAYLWVLPAHSEDGASSTGQQAVAADSKGKESNSPQKADEPNAKPQPGTTVPKVQVRPLIRLRPAIILPQPKPVVVEGADKQDGNDKTNVPTNPVEQKASDVTTVTKTGKSALPPETPTHKQSKEIRIAGAGVPCSLQTFCLAPDGKVVAAVGCRMTPTFAPAANKTPTSETLDSPKGQLRWFDIDGAPLDVWPISIAPTALNFAKDGTVFVGGDGQILKLGKNGEVLLTVDSPNQQEILDKADEILAESRALQGNTRVRLQASLDSSRLRLKELEDKEADAKAEGKELSRTDKVRLTAVRRSIDSLERSIASYKEPTPEQMQLQLKAIANNKKRISGIAVTEKEVFVACYAAIGYGFDIWRLDHQLKNATKVVQKLRGCCGQMDIQADGAGFCVAENSMHRVCRYDRDGKLVKTFGERETVSHRGFEGCCNPMNLRLSKTGEIYTSESSIGRIRRFNADGEYQGLVGQAKLVSGCKHVAVAVSPDTNRVYLLDVTKGEIVILSRDSQAAEVRDDKPRAVDTNSVNRSIGKVSK